MSKGTLVVRAILSCEKLISVNKRLWGSATRGMRHSKEYDKEISQLNESLESQGFIKGSLGNDKLYSITYVLYLKENIVKRDADNLIKCVTDVISKYFGFNDNKIVSYKFSKREVGNFGDRPSNEYVLIEIEQLDGWWDSLRIDFDEFQEFTKRYVENAGP